MAPNLIKPKRRHIVRRFFLIVAAAAILLTVRGGALSELTSAYAVPVLATPKPTPAIYGFSTTLDDLSASALQTKLGQMQAAGATSARFDVDWSIVQPSSASQYNWATYDQIFAALKARNMTAVGVIDFTPAWARVSYCTTSKFCPPASTTQYADFAAAAASRYASYGVHDWEIWNEPNISYRFHPAANAALYTQMLKSAYTAIKKVQPSDIVITGGTAPSDTDSTNLTPSDFLTAIYANGGGGYFDAVAAHPYTYPNSPADNLPDAWYQMLLMHNIMAAHGDGNKKIWITEFGAPTNGPNVAGDHVSEQQQAQILTDAVSMFRSYSWSGPFYWYDIIDAGTGTWDSENFYGLLRADGSEKPAYTAWLNAIQTQ